MRKSLVSSGVCFVFLAGMFAGCFSPTRAPLFVVESSSTRADGTPGATQWSFFVAELEDGTRVEVIDDTGAARMEIRLAPDLVSVSADGCLIEFGHGVIQRAVARDPEACVALATELRADLLDAAASRSDTGAAADDDNEGEEVSPGCLETHLAFGSIPQTNWVAVTVLGAVPVLTAVLARHRVLRWVAGGALAGLVAAVIPSRVRMRNELADLESHIAFCWPKKRLTVHAQLLSTTPATAFDCPPTAHRAAVRVTTSSDASSPTSEFLDVIVRDESGYIISLDGTRTASPTFGLSTVDVPVCYPDAPNGFLSVETRHRWFGVSSGTFSARTTR